uniref:Titin n=1 Tax=Nothobranchius furzeri TaxID=105023 RepID=A0A8C6NPH3_NOTFU
MVLSWEAPSEDGGSLITGYIIEKHDKEGVRWIRCNRQTVTHLTFKVTGLLESHIYEFRVAAENAVGVGEPSTPSVFYKAIDPVFQPGPPRNPRVTDTSKSSVFLSWGKPTKDGGSEIQGYIVECCTSTEPGVQAEAVDAPAEEWKMCTPPTGVKTTKFEAGNLKEHQAYKFRVCAINKVGVGEHADVSGAVVVEDRKEEPDLDIDPELRNIVTIKAGASLRLFIPIKGRPTPAIKWNKDEAALKETAQVEITSSYTSLVIDKMSRNDSGKYTVTAENSSGTKSALVVVRVLDTPSTPVNLKVKEITNQSVTLEWEPPLLDGGSKIKNYIVEKRESTRKTYAAVVTNCHDLSFTIESLQEGCSYYFRVLAENAYGVGLPAVTVDPLKVSEVPQSPQNLIVTDQTKTSISLAWERPEYDGGSRVMQYLLEVQLKGQEKWSGVNTFKTMETTVTNLNPGQEYLFRVTAINDKGKSDPKVLSGPVMTKDLVFEPDIRPAFSSYSVHVGKDMSIDIPIFGRPKPTIAWTKNGAPLKFTTRVNIHNTTTHTILSIKEAAVDDGGMYSINATNSVGKKESTIEIIVLDKPGPPSGPVRFDEITTQSVTISWDPPKHTGGCPISNYIIQKRDATSTTWENVSSNCARTTIKGNEYMFRVMAVNSNGISDPLESAAVIMRNPCVPPGSPHIEDVSNVAHDGMTITWSAPETDGGSKITNYIVEKKDRAGIKWTRCNRQKVTDLSYRVVGLTTDHEYEFRVTAENIVGVGEPSLPTSYYKACDPKYKPGAPAYVNVIDSTKTSITVSWGKPLSDGGSAIQGYIVEMCKAEEEEWTMVTPPTGLRVNKYEIPKLAEGQEYKVQVCALNKIGVGEPAVLSGTAKPEERIDPPHIHLDSELRKGITVKAGASVKMYIPFKGRPMPEIKWTKDEGNLSEKAVVEKAMNFTQLSIDSCDRSDSGKYSLNLTNSSGSVSEFVSVKVLDTPGPPQSLVVKNINRNSATLEWSAPLIDGGSKIKNYVIDKRESTRKAYANVSTKCSKTAFKVENLIEGAMYYFRVMAENEYGIGQAVETKTASKASEVPLPVGKVFLTDVTKSSASLSWEKPEHDGGSRIGGYLIEMQPKGTDKWGVATNTKTCEGTVTGLTAGTEYLFRIIAYNEKGKSEPKALAAPVIASDMTLEPSIRTQFNTYSVLAGKDLKLEFLWTKPQYDGGSKVNGYIVERKDLASPDRRWVRANFTNIIETYYTVTGLTENEQYEFRVTARNVAGVFSEPSESSGVVTATDEIEAPRASMDPKYKDLIVVNAGESLTFDADVYGKPIPDVVWLKEGKELEKALRIEVKSTQKRAAMTIKDVTKLDGGHYDLVLKNLGGTKTFPITVKVLDKPGPPNGPFKVTGVMADRSEAAAEK